MGVFIMKRSTEPFRAGHLRPAFLAGALFATAMLANAAVTPPPLPPGSNLVKVEPGMTKAEQKREERAHHHKGHVKKDVSKDDSKDKDKDKGDKK